jgi:hypothetical protein
MMRRGSRPTAAGTGGDVGAVADGAGRTGAAGGSDGAAAESDCSAAVEMEC